MKLVAVLTVFVVATGFPAHASAAESGDDLRAICVNVVKDSAADISCNLYLSGFSEGLFLGEILQEKGTTTCMPRDAALDYRQTRAILEKYMQDHPEELNRKASILVLRAVASAFPCAPKSD
ncbi:MAG TPA: Rap1a/Tai family immunity protein [Steroidobacteraceae bacterium]